MTNISHIHEPIRSMESARLVVPEEFLCPITHELMRDPLMCRTGFTFERKAVMEWMSEHEATCPLTRTPLTAKDFVSNHALRNRIQQWCRENEVPFEEPDHESEKWAESLLVTCLITDLLPTKASPSTGPRPLTTSSTSPTSAMFCRSSRRGARPSAATSTTSGRTQKKGPWSLVARLSK